MYTFTCSQTPLSHPKCVICGGLNHRKLHRWEVGDAWNPATIPLTIWLCEDCGLASLFPVPEPSQIPTGGDWWSSSRSRPRRRRWLKVRWERFSERVFGSPASRLIRATRRAVRSGRLLDIGCGDGRLLAEASGHFDCVGVEPSPIAANTARQRGFHLIQQSFEDAVLPPESFDVVLMDSIIEHMSEPVGILKKVNATLRMGGVVALRTPKFDGPSYHLHGKAWNGFRHGYHRFLFTGDTLAACLRLAGFELLARPRRDRMLDDILILWGRKSRPIEAKACESPENRAGDEFASPMIPLMPPEASNTAQMPVA